MMRFFSKYTWRFSIHKKEIFLTFDDGPTPEITQFVLEELKKYNAKATFFCIGKNIKKHPEIFTKILSDGHSIGNHTIAPFNLSKQESLHSCRCTTLLLRVLCHLLSFLRLHLCQSRSLIEKMDSCLHPEKWPNDCPFSIACLPNGYLYMG